VWYYDTLAQEGSFADSPGSSPVGKIYSRRRPCTKWMWMLAKLKAKSITSALKYGASGLLNGNILHHSEQQSPLGYKGGRELR